MTLTGLEILPTLLTISITTIVLFILFQYMHTEIPEGVKEVWGARILDTALRTNGHIVRYAIGMISFKLCVKQKGS